MRSFQPGPRPRPLEQRFIPALPALDPTLLAPSFEPPRPPRYPLDSLGEPTLHSFYLARAGVHHAIRQLLGGRPGAVLMPAYHHGVEVEAVRAAGARVVFYRVDRKLRADLDDLERRARQAGARIAYLIHYAGFAQPLDETRALCRDRGLELVEDCALALFSRDPSGRPLGSVGDAAVFCLYKTLPVPHGGLLSFRGAPPEPLDPPPVASTLHHAAGLALAHLELRSPWLGGQARAFARLISRRGIDRVVDTVKTGTQHLQPRELHLGASRLVERICARIDHEMVVVRRRRNFRRLAEALQGAPLLGAPLDEGACPLFLPLRVKSKRAALAGLAARGIEAVDFWRSGDPACDPSEFPEAAALRREVIELPCHQSLDDDAIDFVARAVKEVLSHG